MAHSVNTHGEQTAFSLGKGHIASIVKDLHTEDIPGSSLRKCEVAEALLSSMAEAVARSQVQHSLSDSGFGRQTKDYHGFYKH